MVFLGQDNILSFSKKNSHKVTDVAFAGVSDGERGRLLEGLLVFVVVVVVWVCCSEFSVGVPWLLWGCSTTWCWTGL